MKVTILGCGTSTGVPVIACPCDVCHSPNPKNKRTRASIHVETDQGHSILIDTSPDLRQQCLRENINRMDAVLFTHNHADHCHGIDDLRAFNFIMKKNIPCFANAATLKGLQTSFPYIFQKPAQIGGGLPQLDFQEIEAHQAFKPLEKEPELEVLPLLVHHGHWNILGFRIGSFAYITDTSGLPEESLKQLEGLDLFVIDCLRKDPPHPTHFILDQSVELIQRIKPKHSILTHMAHSLEYETLKKEFSQSTIEPAYDGLQLEL
jgi:phosphoribosyl 1,2-cyclic phosphate phosphodiesterase